MIQGVIGGSAGKHPILRHFRGNPGGSYDRKSSASPLAEPLLGTGGWGPRSQNLGEKELKVCAQRQEQEGEREGREGEGGAPR